MINHLSTYPNSSPMLPEKKRSRQIGLIKTVQSTEIRQEEQKIVQFLDECTKDISREQFNQKIQNLSFSQQNTEQLKNIVWKMITKSKNLSLIEQKIGGTNSQINILDKVSTIVKENKQNKTKIEQYEQKRQLQQYSYIQGIYKRMENILFKANQTNRSQQPLSVQNDQAIEKKLQNMQNEFSDIMDCFSKLRLMDFIKKKDTNPQHKTKNIKEEVSLIVEAIKQLQQKSLNTLHTDRPGIQRFNGNDRTHQEQQQLDRLRSELSEYKSQQKPKNNQKVLNGKINKLQEYNRTRENAIKQCTQKIDQLKALTQNLKKENELLKDKQQKYLTVSLELQNKNKILQKIQSENIEHQRNKQNYIQELLRIIDVLEEQTKQRSAQFNQKCKVLQQKQQIIKRLYNQISNLNPEFLKQKQKVMNLQRQLKLQNENITNMQQKDQKIKQLEKDKKVLENNLTKKNDQVKSLNRKFSSKKLTETTQANQPIQVRNITQAQHAHQDASQTIPEYMYNPNPNIQLSNRQNETQIVKSSSTYHSSLFQKTQELFSKQNQLILKLINYYQELQVQIIRYLYYIQGRIYNIKENTEINKTMKDIGIYIQTLQMKEESIKKQIIQRFKEINPHQHNIQMLFAQDKNCNINNEQILKSFTHSTILKIFNQIESNPSFHDYLHKPDQNYGIIENSQNQFKKQIDISQKYKVIAEAQNEINSLKRKIDQTEKKNKQLTKYIEEIEQKNNGKEKQVQNLNYKLQETEKEKKDLEERLGKGNG